MNNIYLEGRVCSIRPSHKINGVEYSRADLIVTRPDGKEDILILKFKNASASGLKENDWIKCVGNVRSYSYQRSGVNKVEIYVFSHIDKAIEDPAKYSDTTNLAELDGRICKIDELRYTKKQAPYIHFILANNLDLEDGHKLNSYIPCVLWGKAAVDFSKQYSVGDRVVLQGQLHSREYRKMVNSDYEIHVAHELLVTALEKSGDL